MKGIIKIKDYRIHCIVGACTHERDQEQEILVDLELEANFAECVLSDTLVDTIDYEEIVEVCRNLAQTEKFTLIETFAYEALNALFSKFSFSWGKISVKKPDALPLAS